jgi:hypothetical protein
MRPSAITILVSVAVLGAVCSRRAIAEGDSNATLVGYATLPAPVELPATGRVHVRFFGAAALGDECPDHTAGRFIAAYDGTLVVEPDGRFEAQLVPFSPPVTTPAGCPITNLDFRYIDSITITAELPGLDGQGWLTFQTLSSADNSDLQNGDFGNLHAQLLFRQRPTA